MKKKKNSKPIVVDSTQKPKRDKAKMKRKAKDSRRRENKCSKTACKTVGLLFLIVTAFLVAPTLSFQTNTKAIKFKKGFSFSQNVPKPDSIIGRLTEQISLAKAYVVIAEEINNLQFALELSAQIRESQVVLSNTGIRQTQLKPEELEMAIHDMALLLNKAQNDYHYDSALMITELKAKTLSLKEQVKSAIETSIENRQNASEGVPKGLYCLGVRLTVELLKNKETVLPMILKGQDQKKLTDNNLYHFCIFSDNILATSVVVNSTASNFHNPDRIVFHIITDELNFTPMSTWFALNSFHGAAIEIQHFEDFRWLNASYAPVLGQLQDPSFQEFYFSGNTTSSKTAIKFGNPKYICMLNHLRFYIPEIFPALEKIVFLDDDIVVQKDLSPLFSIDLKGNVNGAVETCNETSHRFHHYLNFSNRVIHEHYDLDGCSWAYGMNIFDLVEWRKRNLTGIYHYWQQKNVNRTLWNLGTLPPGLLMFYGSTETLDPMWHILRLGNDNADPELIEKGAVLHFNGNAKPWLNIGMEKYKPLWNKYVDFSHPLLQQCNVY